MENCSRCGAPNSPFGLGPPAKDKTEWFCGSCIAFDPVSQANQAKQLREALEDDEILVR